MDSIISCSQTSPQSYEQYIYYDEVAIEQLRVRKLLVRVGARCTFTRSLFREAPARAANESGILRLGPAKLSCYGVVGYGVSNWSRVKILLNASLLARDATMNIIRMGTRNAIFQGKQYNFRIIQLGQKELRDGTKNDC